MIFQVSQSWSFSIKSGPVEDHNRLCSLNRPLPRHPMRIGRSFDFRTNRYFDGNFKFCARLKRLTPPKLQKNSSRSRSARCKSRETINSMSLWLVFSAQLSCLVIFVMNVQRRWAVASSAANSLPTCQSCSHGQQGWVLISCWVQSRA